ncbi:MAG TPA: glutathione S-transferase family protein [Polyangia bacterium]
MLIFFGAPASSAGKTHWMLEEVGVPYEYRRVELRDPATAAEYRKVNPGGKVPFIVDGDVRLFESMAINFYLAERYKPELMPRDPIERALCYQWSFWTISNLQPEALTVMIEHFKPESARNDTVLTKAMTHVARLLAQLESSLVGPYILGERFTVADVNAGSVINLALRAGAASHGPQVSAWMERLRARPAYQRAVNTA